MSRQLMLIAQLTQLLIAIYCDKRNAGTHFLLTGIFNRSISLARGPYLCDVMRSAGSFE